MRVKRIGTRIAVGGVAVAFVASLLSPAPAFAFVEEGVTPEFVAVEQEGSGEGAAKPEEPVVTDEPVVIDDSTVAEEPVATDEVEVADDTAPEELPAELRAAIERDLGISPDEYLARAQAAEDVEGAVDDLLAAGVEVLGTELDGLEATVYVADAPSAEAVEAAGMRAVVGEPAVFDTSGYDLELKDDVRGGTPYVFEDGTRTHRCSVGVAGYSVASGAQQLLTAGHCEGDAASMRQTIGASRPNQFSGSAVNLGLPVSGSYHLGDGYDHGLIAAQSGRNLVPELLTWGGGSGAPMASTPVKVRDATRAVVGAPLCRTGSTSGWRCGEILAVDAETTISGNTVTGIVAQLCSRGGDSGGAAVSGTTAVGITSGGSASGANGSCTSEDITIFTQLYGRAESAKELYNGAWEPMVAVSRPVVTTPAGYAYDGSVIKGTLPYGKTRHRVVVVIDGSITRTATVSSSGTWQVSVSGLGAGPHTYVARAWWDKHSRSSAVSGSWDSSITASRLYGASRYETAVAISKSAFPNGAKIVFIASGETYPDALSAGPVAAKRNGPLLLTPKGSLPSSVKAELKRLNPDRIVVVGGTGAVSSTVSRALKSYGATSRVAGADRYETSRKIADFGFGAVDRVFVATGRDFPDALSAGAAAAALRVPVVLIDGKASRMDGATSKLLRTTFDPDRILIAGGTGAVSSGMQSSLGGIATTQRLAGLSRYETSLKVNDYAHDRSSRAYFALGTNFPDALAGGVLAGLRGAPMYITPSTCVPGGIVDHVRTIGATRVTLFGGPTVLTSGVAALRRC